VWNVHVDFNERQRALLLRGLRFVRSSRMMEFREQSDLTDEERAQELAEIRKLVEILDSKGPALTPAHAS
jgi:hypothetical protein